MSEHASARNPGSEEETITGERLVADLRKLGVRRGDLLNIKVSLRSIGYVVGGADTLVEALLDVVGAEGTIVSDSFITTYPLRLSRQNAVKISDRLTPSYAGATANAMIRHPLAFRSQHPIQKFVAIGAQAKELMLDHTPSSFAYAVLQRMCSMGGRNLKIGTDEQVPGVGTTHVAVGILGFRQRRPPLGVNYRDEQGNVRTATMDWAGGCPLGFNKFIPLYREAGAILHEGTVGEAESKITDMALTLQVELGKLSEDPAFFLCDDPACESCRLSWEFSTGSRASVFCHKAIRRMRRALEHQRGQRGERRAL